MTDGCAPYLDEHGCTVYPPCPAVAYEPARVTHPPILGWNAGANSIQELSGDLHTVFTMPAVVGIVIGLRSGRLYQTAPDFIEHGLYFASFAGVHLVHVEEGGRTITANIGRSTSDSFEIRRVAGQVTYWRNGALLHVSTLRSSGSKVINACLYASGDGV